VAAFLVIFISTFFYKEKVQDESESQPGIIKSVVECFKNRAFVMFEILSFTVIFIQTILMQGVIYYFDEFTTPMPLAYGALGLGAVGGIVLWIKMLRPWGVRKCVTVMCIAFAAGAMAMCVLGRIMPVALVVFFLTGVGFAGGMYLVPIMNGDVIDYDELKTGARREGIYAGVNSLITKPAISLANGVFPIIAGWFGYNFDLKAGEQSAMAGQGILVAWMAIPAILLVISAISMKFYPLYGEKWDRQKAEIAERHEQ
jgi:GPH family glycoside/pentoside/hexuronide:cation symporter